MKHTTTLTKTLLITFSVMLLSTPVLAEIKMTQTAEVEVEQKDAKGKVTVKLLPADKAVPGDTIVYTITATNEGKEAADNVMITNAISEHMIYVADSAQSSAMGKNTTITYSTDGGNAFAPSGQLTVMEDGELRPAITEDYTHIRWQLNFALAPGKNAKVMFKARVK